MRDWASNGRVCKKIAMSAKFNTFFLLSLQATLILSVCELHLIFILTLLFVTNTYFTEFTLILFLFKFKCEWVGNCNKVFVGKLDVFFFLYLCNYKLNQSKINMIFQKITRRRRYFSLTHSLKNNCQKSRSPLVLPIYVVQNTQSYLKNRLRQYSPSLLNFDIFQIFS